MIKTRATRPSWPSAVIVTSMVVLYGHARIHQTVRVKYWKPQESECQGKDGLESRLACIHSLHMPLFFWEK